MLSGDAAGGPGAHCDTEATAPASADDAAALSEPAEPDEPDEQALRTRGRASRPTRRGRTEVMPED